MANNESHHVVGQLRKIMNDRGIKQATMASYAETSPSQFSKILSGSVALSLAQLSNIALCLELREIDIYTYPEIYVANQTVPKEDVEAILQIRLKKDKKDQVLKLVFGENNIEILNK